MPNQSVLSGPGSGIDPRYLQQFADNNVAYISGHQRSQMSPMNAGRPIHSNPMFYGEMQEISPYPGYHRTGINQNSATLNDVVCQNQLRDQNASNSEYYRNRSPMVPDQNKSATFKSQLNINTRTPYPVQSKQADTPKCVPKIQDGNNQKANTPTTSAPNFVFELDSLKNEVQNPAKTRFDRLRALHKSGPRVFSGPVEKVLKWHKSLQDIGLLVLYEIVAKFVSVRPGESCAKNLVIRDESGPAMQVVYYEIDFLMPDLRPSSTVRIVGRMMPGTCRLQAFSVRAAIGNDVAMLPRRAAIAAHHVAKLCKEYAKPNP